MGHNDKRESYWRHDSAGFQPQFRALSSGSADAPRPLSLIAGSASLLLSSGYKRAPGYQLLNTQMLQIHTQRALSASCLPLVLSCAALPRTTSLQGAQGGSPRHLHSLDFGEEKGQRPHPRSGLPARAPSQAPRSCPCARPPRGDTTRPTQLSLLVPLAIAQARAHRSGQSRAQAQCIGPETQ